MNFMLLGIYGKRCPQFAAFRLKFTFVLFEMGGIVNSIVVVVVVDSLQFYFDSFAHQFSFLRRILFN
ncbi:hypothetical protein T01_2021 [Trichinella spiralis]|uniref:Uncharacterized protein n=1 Tax=Trichinella spiralis TaxID=6334 RepID=A0A0V1BL40_TRISP|nr:hypothetical protein T01_2021 [Trichinella spiralis]